MNKLMAIAAAALTALSTSAISINITVDASGNLLNGIGIANDAQYAQPNNNPSSNLTFLNNEIANWNGVPLVPVLPAAGALALDQGSLGGVTSYSGPAGYDYVVFHFGAGQAGGHQVSSGGWHQAYFLNGDSISFAAVPQVGGENVGGFSSARYFGTHTTNTPDGGATVGLFGLGLVGLSAVRRFAKA